MPDVVVYLIIFGLGFAAGYGVGSKFLVHRRRREEPAIERFHLLRVAHTLAKSGGIELLSVARTAPLA